MKRSFFFVLGLAVFLGTSFEAGAQQKGFSQEEPTLNRKVRNLGMGNVGVAIEGDADSSPFYNPAGLNDLTKGRFQFLSITGEISRNSFGTVGEVKDLLNDIDDATTDADKVRALNKYVKDNTGEPQHMRISMDIFNYARKNFAAGLLFDQRLDLAFRNDVPDSFEMRNLGDVAMYVSGSYGFWEKLLQMGVTLRPTVRFSLDEADQKIEPTDVQGEDANGNTPLQNQVEKIYKDRRFGLSADVGLKSNLGFSLFKDKSWYKLLRPQVGFTWQDIGSPSFSAAPGNYQSMTLGASISPMIWKLKNSLSVDVRGLNREIPMLAKLHVGLESKLPWILALRAGMSQGYVTAGVGLDLWLVKIDGAMYFEETGQKVRENGDMRFAVNLSFNI